MSAIFFIRHISAFGLSSLTSCSTAGRLTGGGVLLRTPSSLRLDIILTESQTSLCLHRLRLESSTCLRFRSSCLR